jgi:polysaccharide export outer membrane protein
MSLKNISCPWLAAAAVACLWGGSLSSAQASGAAKGAASATGSASVERAKTPEAPDYRIGPGDVLAVEVWKEPDASTPTVIVRPDGKVSLAMVGDYVAAGHTPQELEEALAVKYREFVRAARVTVTVKEINSQKVYLIGEVKKEGAIRIQAPITVLQALAEAGGVTDYAKRKKIYVLRTENNQHHIFPFDYDSVVHGEKLEQNIVLAPGDTIVVPR